MKQEHGTEKKPLYSLISLEDFKAVLGVDERDDTLSGYCLLTASYAIEQYCKRRFLRKKYFEHIAYTGDLVSDFSPLPMREYPVSEILMVHLIPDYREPAIFLEPDFYDTVPDCGTFDDIPFSIALSTAVKRYPKIAAIEVMYYAGYEREDIPPDLSMACLELAAWNMNRYKGQRIGMVGNIRRGKDGELLEKSMPENVRCLLEPYKRKLI
jgi:hypothetical protein